MKEVNVAVGVILRNEKVFITKRASNAHQGGKWEFPGGKIEPGETATIALARELKEEVDIEIDASKCIFLSEIAHDYGDKRVRLHVWTIDTFNGEPRGAEGQLSCWVSQSELGNYDFPVANKPIIDALVLK